MRVPSAIDANTIKAYEAHPRVVASHNQNLESFNLEGWDKKLPKTLRELCVQTIAANWADNPILDEIILLVDRHLLLDILGTDLPLKLTIPKIPDDVYWKKCYLEKWPKQLPSKVKPIEISEIVKNNDTRKLSSVCSANGNNLSDSHSSQASQKSQRRSLNGVKHDPEKRSWKEYYIEMHLKEYIENLKPEDYDAEKMKELTDLCSDYVRFLRIEEMRCSENSSNRIPLNSALIGFQHLRELSICFKQTYAGEQFSWNILNTSFQDIKLLAKGLEKLRLYVLRIRNSDINCEKLIIILKALLKHDIRVLDFLHCKIADKGTLAISKFILEVPIVEINLANNRVGPKGVEYISYALRQSSCALVKLDLHLNQLSDNAGNLLLSALNRNTIKSLFLSGCGFSETLSVGRLLQTNSSLEFLDISNNSFGDTVGRTILEGLKTNTTIKKLDLRMCKISSQTEFHIQELVNTKRKRRVAPIVQEIQDDYKIEINDDVLNAEFETILQ